MADDHRRLRDLPDVALEVVDDLLDPHARDPARVAALRFHAVGLARPLGHQDLVALLLEVRLEVLPAARGEPRAVDENDRPLHAAPPLIDAPTLMLSPMLMQHWSRGDAPEAAQSRPSERDRPGRGPARFRLRGRRPQSGRSRDGADSARQAPTRDARRAGADLRQVRAAAFDAA